MSKYQLGSKTDFDFSPTAITNINKLLTLLKSRLNSSAKSKSIDSNGNVTYIDSDIFSVDMLTHFLLLSLSDFNQTPYFTFYTFDDTEVVDTFTEVLVTGATLQALASQALIERGREFTIDDGDGISFNPPSLAELLNTQYNTLIFSHHEKLKRIKEDSTIREFINKKKK